MVLHQALRVGARKDGRREDHEVGPARLCLADGVEHVVDGLAETAGVGRELGDGDLHGEPFLNVVGRVRVHRLGAHPLQGCERERPQADYAAPTTTMMSAPAVTAQSEPAAEALAPMSVAIWEATSASSGSS